MLICNQRALHSTGIVPERFQRHVAEDIGVALPLTSKLDDVLGGLLLKCRGAQSCGSLLKGFYHYGDDFRREGTLAKERVGRHNAALRLVTGGSAKLRS